MLLQMEVFIKAAEIVAELGPAGASGMAACLVWSPHSVCECLYDVLVSYHPLCCPCCTFWVVCSQHNGLCCVQDSTVAAMVALHLPVGVMASAYCCVVTYWLSPCMP